MVIGEPAVPVGTTAAAVRTLASDPDNFGAAVSAAAMSPADVTASIGAADFVCSAMRCVSGLRASVFFEGAFARGASAVDAAMAAGCEAAVASSVPGADERRGYARIAIKRMATPATPIASGAIGSAGTFDDAAVASGADVVFFFMISLAPRRLFGVLFARAPLSAASAADTSNVQLTRRPARSGGILMT